MRGVRGRPSPRIAATTLRQPRLRMLVQPMITRGYEPYRRRLKRAQRRKAARQRESYGRRQWASLERARRALLHEQACADSYLDRAMLALFRRVYPAP